MNEKPNSTEAPEDKEKGKGISSRRTAVEVLISIEKDSAYANIVLNNAFRRKQLSDRDKAFVTALVQGVVRHRMQLDDKLKKLSKQPFDKMPETLRNILRVALFQLDFMSDMPESAVVNTSVQLAKKLGHEGHGKFVNGVLRNYIRSRSASTPDVVPEEEDTADPIQKFMVKYSLPEWLIRRWIQNYGSEEAEKLFQFSQSTPEVTLRSCELSITPEGLAQVFGNKEIAFHKGKLVESCFILDDSRHLSPEKLPGYKEGLFAVQDEAAAFVSIVVDPKPQELIVDLCAAPGGKSLHMGELMNNTGRIVAVDIKANRLNSLKSNRNRLGLTNIEIIEADARSFEPDRPADKVLLDAPCSGTGVINRRSDLRFNRDAADIEALVTLQRELLANAAKMLKPGGVLVYSTCSIEPEENFDNVRWFLKEFGDFRPDDISPYLPEFLKAEIASTWGGPACKTESEMTVAHMLQLLPSRHGTSGFFISRLKKL